MKKIVSFGFILAFSLQFNAAYGQQNTFALGVELGPSYTYLYGNPMLENNYETTINFYSGWSFQYNINSVFSLRTGFASEIKGHTTKFQATDPNGMPIGLATAKMRYSYITVPLLLRATFGQNFKYFINLGSYGGYALEQTATIETPSQPDQEMDESELLKPYDFGFSAGAGVSYPVSQKLELSLELRNNLGLVNISEVPVFQDGSIKTNALNLLVGLAYKFGETTQPVK